MKIETTYVPEFSKEELTEVSKVINIFGGVSIGCIMDTNLMEKLYKIDDPIIKDRVIEEIKIAPVGALIRIDFNKE